MNFLQALQLGSHDVTEQLATMLEHKATTSDQLLKQVDRKWKVIVFRTCSNKIFLLRCFYQVYWYIYSKFKL